MKYTPNVNLQCPDQDSDILHTNYLFCGNMEKIDAYLGQWSGRSARINVSNYHWEVYDDVKKEWVDTGLSVSLIDRGVWNATTTYALLDFVRFNGSSYVYLHAEASSGHELTEESYWGYLAQKGDKGDAAFNPTVTVKTNTDTEFVLTVTDNEGTYDTPNLKGYSPKIAVKTQTDTEYVLEVTDKDGVKTTPNLQGQDGFTPSIIEKTKTETEYVLTINNENGSVDTPNLQGQNGFTPVISEKSKTDIEYVLTITNENGSMDTPNLQGQDGFTPTVAVKKQTPDEYILTITGKDGEMDTPNLKGQDGKGSGDMLKSVYDSDNDGVVNNAKLLDGHSLDEIALNSELQFTDGRIEKTRVNYQIKTSHVPPYAHEPEIQDALDNGEITICSNDFVYENRGISVAYISGYGSWAIMPKNLIIPAVKIDTGAPVTTINPGAFDSKGIEHVVFSNKIMSIQASSFRNNSIKRLILPDSITSLGTNSFTNNPSLEYVKLPLTSDGMKRARNAFKGCNLSNIDLPEGIEVIAGDMFADNHIEHIVIPSTLISIHDAFKNNGLKKITLKGGKHKFMYSSPSWSGNLLTEIEWLNPDDDLTVDYIDTFSMVYGAVAAGTTEVIIKTNKVELISGLITASQVLTEEMKSVFKVVKEGV